MTNSLLQSDTSDPLIVTEITDTQVSLELCSEDGDTNVALTNKIGKEDQFYADADQGAGVSLRTPCTSTANRSRSFFRTLTYAKCPMDQGHWNIDKASVVDDAFYVEVEAAYTSYTRQLDIKFGIFSRAGAAPDKIIWKAATHVYSTLHSMSTESLQLKAHVLAQLRT